MSAPQIAEGLVRQSPEEIERLRVAAETARDLREKANLHRASRAELLAQALVSGLTRDDVPEWVQDFKDACVASEEAREAWMAARVAWYHALGRHATKDPAQCCAPSPEGA